MSLVILIRPVPSYQQLALINFLSKTISINYGHR